MTGVDHLTAVYNGEQALTKAQTGEVEFSAGGALNEYGALPSSPPLGLDGGTLHWTGASPSPLPLTKRNGPAASLGAKEATIRIREQ